MTQCNAVDEENIGVGSELLEMSRGTNFSRKIARFVRRATQIGVCAETLTIARLLEKTAKRESPIFCEKRLFPPKEDYKGRPPT